MHFALVLVGAVVGLMIGSLLGSGDAAVGLLCLLGAAVGYGVAEFRALLQRMEGLEREVARLSERGARSGEAWAMGGAGGAPAFEPYARGARQVPARDVVATPGDAADGGTTRGAASRAGASERIGAGGRAGASEQIDGAAGGANATVESQILHFIREYFTGGNTLVRVGILILFFGVAFLLRYVAEHSHVPIQYRLSGVACGGVALLILGWRLRAKRAGYALALQGGGVGILYLTAFAALRLYSVLPPVLVFAILVVLAVFCAVLAVFQNSQAFAFLAVTGGFLAPVLASTGQGSHVVLFTYYAILNASILAIAWYKAWRPLNLAGFTFTFLISASWGALHYKSELFVSTEPFLVLFFVFYVAIAILFSLRQPPNLRGYVDGTIVFGTPIAAFGYQTGLLHDRPRVLAFSAVVVGAAYLALAWLVQRRQRSSQRLLVEAFIALAVVFFTVATPLALDGTATGVTWALEGAALIWIGCRQSRVIGRLFGVSLQLIAAAIQIFAADLFSTASAPAAGLYLARVITAVAAIFSAVLLRKYADRQRPFETALGPVMFFLGLAEWLYCGLIELDRYAPYHYELTISLVFVALTALASSELSRRTVLSLARLPALWLLPALAIFAAFSLVPPVRHPFDYGGWLAWSLAFACFYIICRRHEGAADKPLASWLHILSAWLLIALLTWQVQWLIAIGVAGRGSWPAIGWVLIPACALYVLPRLSQRMAWPLRAHREAYMVFAGGGVALYLAVWSLAANVSLPGDPYPFPYVPLLNALDLAQALVLLVLARHLLHLRRSRLVIIGVGPMAALSGSLVFVWLNAVLIRTLHRWAGIPLELDAVVTSTLVQTSLSIFWTVLALTTMLVAARRASRPVWITGASLLAVTILKLFVIDLSRVGTVERIVSFVGVGLLTLVIGYFSPLPPAATTHRTTVS